MQRLVTWGVSEVWATGDSRSPAVAQDPARIFPDVVHYGFKPCVYHPAGIVTAGLGVHGPLGLPRRNGARD